MPPTTTITTRAVQRAPTTGRRSCNSIARSRSPHSPRGTLRGFTGRPPPVVRFRRRPRLGCSFSNAVCDSFVTRERRARRSRVAVRATRVGGLRRAECSGVVALSETAGTGLDRVGPSRTGPGRTGLNRTELDGIERRGESASDAADGSKGYVGRVLRTLVWTTTPDGTRALSNPRRADPAPSAARRWTTATASTSARNTGSSTIAATRSGNEN